MSLSQGLAAKNTLSVSPMLRHYLKRSYTSLNRPGPLPLGNKKKQQEMLDLIRNKQQRDLKNEGALHDDARTLEPEFQGDVNPKTGEVNGPKNEPLKHGDWSFGGRVTDF
ncbi:putative mitochondrial protein, conserved [Apophysomyces sp. BC1015]|nr:putative mitochondrial protein, conserved [Apophysomyces sp. BC1015]